MSAAQPEPSGDPAQAIDAPGGLPTWVLMAAPPLAVVVALAVTRNLLAAFLVYHVGMCLVLPTVDALMLRRMGVGAYLQALGLGVRARFQEWTVGVVVAVASFVGILGPVALDPGLLPAAEIGGRLAAWGFDPAYAWWLLAYMVVFNSGAEEVYWRGYVYHRLFGDAQRQRWAPGRLVHLGRIGEPRVLLLAATFTSYHVYTLWALTGDPVLTALGAVGVFLGAVVWSELREHTSTLWPALLAHAGATVGYMVVYVAYVAPAV